MEVSWSVEVVDGVSLVSVVVESDVPLARRVRVRNRLDGRVLPPRRRGIPAAGWDDDGFTTDVPPSSTVAAGYACPAPPVDPPVELVAVTGVDDGNVTGSAPHDDPVARAIRTLGPARPPRDAVPLPDFPDATTVETVDTEARAETDPDFDGIERRIAVAEGLDGAPVREATAVLDDLGGLAGVVGLRAQLAADGTTLADSEPEPDDLRERLADVDVPFDALRRLA